MSLFKSTYLAEAWLVKQLGSSSAPLTDELTSEASWWVSHILSCSWQLISSTTLPIMRLWDLMNHKRTRGLDIKVHLKQSFDCNWCYYNLLCLSDVIRGSQHHFYSYISSELGYFEVQNTILAYFWWLCSIFRF